MKRLYFGTAGVPLSAVKQDTESGIRRIAELGLDALELEFVRGVRLGLPQAEKIKAAAQAHEVLLSAHGPYYVNLNAIEPEKLENTRNHLLKTAAAGAAAGAVSFTFHPGFYLGQPSEEVYERIKTRLAQLVAQIRLEGFEIEVAPELTGKPTQFGALEELLRLCQDIPGLKLCIDFAHAHARCNGALNGYEDFCGILEKVKAVDEKLLSGLHMHVSGIEYGAKGEKKHLPLKESSLDYVGLLRALKDYEVKGILVCESPILEQDALLLKETYYRL